jgi:hypothetical protein
VAPQYFFPSAGTQLQAGCAHLDVAFIRTPLPSVQWCGLAIALNDFQILSWREQLPPARNDSIAPEQATIRSILLSFGRYRNVKFNLLLNWSSLAGPPRLSDPWTARFEYNSIATWETENRSISLTVGQLVSATRQKVSHSKLS